MSNKMIDRKPDNPPAFPTKVTSEDNEAEGGGYQTGNLEWQMPGMTLRDYFAAKAMQGYLAAGTHRIYKDGAELTNGISGAAYELADSMLKARDK